MQEFEWIARYFAPLAGEGSFGLQDDAACLAPDPGKHLVLTKDALVAGTHFFAEDPPYCLARKLLRVNLSDLAAKGAEPLGYLLALMLPRGTAESWIESFADGLLADQEHYGIRLLGGDTTRTDGPLCLSLTAIGRVESGKMLRRSGAQAGDDLYITGTLGDAALWLAAHKQGVQTAESLHKRYLLPQPRAVLGSKLVLHATACLDISDGLLADAGHLATASGLSLIIEQTAIPLSTEAKALLQRDESLWQTILAGGDDYELLFTAPPEQAGALQALAKQTKTLLQRIGRAEAGRGVEIRNASGEVLSFAQLGWQHF